MRMSTRPETRLPARQPVLMSAGIILAVALMLVFILRDVLTTGSLPGAESRSLYSSEVYTRSVLATGELPYWNPFYFGGTSLLILVGVALNTTQQIQSYLLTQKYDAFMRGAKIRSRRVQY